MTRSIELYEKKYPNDKMKALNDFMKASSLIKNEIKKEIEVKVQVAGQVDSDGNPLAIKPSQKGILESAYALLVNSLERTDDYELKRSILRYLIQAEVDQKDYVKALEYGNRLFVESKEKFDDQMLIRSSQVILNSLAHLRQNDRIKEFLESKTVVRVLPVQIGHAYLSFLGINNNKYENIIKRFEASNKGYSQPIHHSILFNTAEAYFRNAEYEKAYKLFDDIITHYSQTYEADQSRLRLALCYDLLDKNYLKVTNLYKEAINKTSDTLIRREAKLRYIGHNLLRKRNPTETDFEVRAFLTPTAIEKRMITPNLKRMQWQARLRAMIVAKEYEDALAYLTTLPLESMELTQKRVIEGDGAEVILGLIQQHYLAEEFDKVVKVWKVFKDRYTKDIGVNPYLNYLVTESYMKLGLEKSYNQSYKALAKLDPNFQRTYPLWVKPHRKGKVADYLNELELGKYLLGGHWKQFSAFLDKNKNNKNINYCYYLGLSNFKLKKFQETIKNLEVVISSEEQRNRLTPAQKNKLVEIYVESLYYGDEPQRFRRNATALIADLRASNTLNEVLQRTEYLMIESLFNEQEPNYELITQRASEFLKDFSAGGFKDRIHYVYGKSLIQSAQAQEGKKVLEDLINNEKTTEVLKELARAEISKLTLEGRTL